MNKFKLFCFPYAGGSAVVYHGWKRYLDPRIELIPIELAGRGKRMSEPPYRTIEEATEDVYRLISRQLTGSPYAFFGHSMGSLIAYELAQLHSREGLPAPLHIFFSGRSSPDVCKSEEDRFHLLNDTDFRNRLIALGGTPPELFTSRQLMDIFVPLLRNDFRITETYLPPERIEALDCNITILLGRNDGHTVQQSQGWRAHTKKECHIHIFEGGHFFLHENAAPIAGIINRTLIN